MTQNMFDLLKSNYVWNPIRNCPGRFILADGVISLSIQDLIGVDIDVYENVFKNTADPVSYCYFKGGGLISYKKPEGYLHTLCNQEGMERKMAMLSGQQSQIKPMND